MTRDGLVVELVATGFREEVDPCRWRSADHYGGLASAGSLTLFVTTTSSCGRLGFGALFVPVWTLGLGRSEPEVWERCPDEGLAGSRSYSHGVRWSA